MSRFFYICLLLSFTACTEQSKKAASLDKKNANISVSSLKDSIKPDVLPIFTREKFQQLADSVITWDNIKIKVEVDSLVSDTLTLTRFKFMKGRQQYSLYEIYNFKTIQCAQDFYNDLETQEFVQMFGIDKRPQHILINGNLVVWHHLEHWYGHRVDQFNKVFNYLMPFKKDAPNLDSMSGFTYCNCGDKEYEIKSLMGKWKSVRSFVPYQDTSVAQHYFDALKAESKKEMSVIIRRDSIILNGQAFVIKKAPTFIELPDSKFFIKYKFISSWDYGHVICADFLNEVRKIQAMRQKVNDIFVAIGYRQRLNFISLENGKMYLYANYIFYEIKRLR